MTYGDGLWLYGPFATEIPRRLGTNTALDDAVLATLSIHTEACVRTVRDDPQATALTAYYRALSTLRTTLDDHVQALSSETLSGIMLLVSGHARIDGPFASFWSPHGKGMVQLLRLRQSREDFGILGIACTSSRGSIRSTNTILDAATSTRTF